jgi:hypothetical protein
MSRWIKCAVHGGRYPAGGSCAKCARNINPVSRQRASSPRTTTKTVQPFRCACGRMVTNSQGICPGPDC